MTRLLRLLLLPLWALSALPVGCAFDDSGLALNLRCIRDDDCVRGVCISRRCTTTDADPGQADAALDDDGGPPDQDLPFTPDPDRDCPAGQVAACSTCLPLDQTPGQPCSGECGVWACLTAASGATCRAQPRNACGGCSRLPLQPGAGCGGGCGEVVCDGTEATRCDERPRNGCGGCVPLPGRVGEACGTCGGRWVCEGSEALRCSGESTNFCGGCGGPPEAAFNVVCACPGDTSPDPARWTCEATTIVCRDRVDARFLGDRSDADTGPPIRVQDTLQVPGDEDTFVARALDVLSQDPMRPEVTLSTPESSALRLCATWEYADERGPLRDPTCIEGRRTSLDGLTWCCFDITPPRNQARVILGSTSGGRLDTRDGADNDNGILTVLVLALDGTATCIPYELAVTF
jgi:hypothetical protein